MSRRIIVLSGLGAVVSAYFIFFKDREDFFWLLGISIVIGILGYMFQHQIDEIILRGAPQKLDDSMRKLLFSTSPLFVRLHLQHQLLVEDRMKRWVLKKDFIQKNEQDAPEDVKYILAYYAILLTLHQKDYLYTGVDRIAFYHHPFLSPAYEDDVHIAEVELEDGTMIISVPHLIKGHLEKGYYNIGLHLLAEAYQKVYIKENLQWPEDIWMSLEEISNITRDQIEDYIGLPLTDPWPVAVHHQVIYSGANIREVTSILPQLTHASSVGDPE